MGELTALLAGAGGAWPHPHPRAPTTCVRPCIVKVARADVHRCLLQFIYIRNSLQGRGEDVPSDKLHH